MSVSACSPSHKGTKPQVVIMMFVFPRLLKIDTAPLYTVNSVLIESQGRTGLCLSSDIPGVAVVQESVLDSSHVQRAVQSAHSTPKDSRRSPGAKCLIARRRTTAVCFSDEL